MLRRTPTIDPITHDTNNVYGHRIARTALAVILSAWGMHCSSEESAGAAGADHDAKVDADGTLLDAGQIRDANEEGPVRDSAVAPPADANEDARTSPEASVDAALSLYHPCPPAGTPCAIMPTGDSITAGYQSSTGGGYRLRLLHDIWSAHHEATFVGDSSSGPNSLDGKPFPKENEGHSAFTIDDAPAIGRSGISPLVPPALVKYAPHIVTLMIGTNDVGTSNDLPNAPARLAHLIDAIIATSPNALLVVAQITPTGDDAANTRTQVYNAAISSLVKSRSAAGKHIILVDMFSAFTANANYRTALMHDSLHPNDAGYDLMGDVWYNALAPHL